MEIPPVLPIKLHFLSLFEKGRSEVAFYNRVCTQHGGNYTLIVEDPREADYVILLGLQDQGNFTPDTFEHEIFAKYPTKCIVISECDEPVELWPGLYTSGRRDGVPSGYIEGWFYPFHDNAFPNIALANRPPTASEKKYIASFIGTRSHILRNKISRLYRKNPDIFLKIETSYRHFDHDFEKSSEAQSRYADIMCASHFSLCPRGKGLSSMRIFESMRMGVAPVILSDNWIPSSLVEWEHCSLRIRERELKNLHSILVRNLDRSKELGEAARHAYENCFAQANIPRQLTRALPKVSWKGKSLKGPSQSFHRNLFKRRTRGYRFAYYKARMGNAAARLHDFLTAGGS